MFIQRDSFPLNAGRIDMSRLGESSSDRKILAAQVDNLLSTKDSLVQSSGSNEMGLMSPPQTVRRDGNHLTIDRQEGQATVHEEQWFTPKLDLKTAEYPEEAQDRTYLTRYTMTPDLNSGVMNVEKATDLTYAAPEWNLADSNSPAPKHWYSL